MNTADFQWQERQGRFDNDEPFHEWIYVHGSGRILGSVQGPADKRGGFAHNIQFLFAQEVTMRGGPFFFLDFDSGKRFVESVVLQKVLDVTTDGVLTVVPTEMNPELAGMMKQLTDGGMVLMKQIATAKAQEAVPQD